MGICIQPGGLVVFPYLMDKKDEDEWLRKKERVVQETRIGSLLAALHRENGDYGALSDYFRYCLRTGGFPIVVGGTLAGSICVSGLSDLEDHELLMEALEEYKTCYPYG